MSRNPSRRRWRVNLCVGCLFAGLLPVAAAEARSPSAWTLQEALDHAFAESPVLGAGQARLLEVESGLVGARTYPYNPELTLAVADRSSPGSSTTDRGLSLSQELEVAGQRRRRIAVAEEELRAAEAVLARARRLLASRVESAFAEAVRYRELARVAQADAALARDFLDYSQRRLEAGAVSQIEVNLARATAGRAERSLQLVRAAYARARSVLAEAAGGDPATPPEPLGELPAADGTLAPLPELLDLAVENRADLESLRHRRQAAEASRRLALAARSPNLTIDGFYEHEEDTDRIFGAGLTISVPLFNRNQGDIARTEATVERVGQDAAALRLSVRQEVATAYANLQAARAAAEFLRTQVVGTLEDNVGLLQRSFAAGKIGAAELVIFRREFVESQREYVGTLADAWQARIALDLATGRLAASGVPAREERR